MIMAKRHVYYFLADNAAPQYVNPQKVGFILNPDESVMVSYGIEDRPEKDIELVLRYTSDSFNDFIREFQLAGVQDLQAISPDRLQELYYKGQAEFNCIFEVKLFYFSLRFRLQGNKMIVCDDNDNTYELDEILETPGQIMEYTRQQARLHALLYGD
jgi:hypothetical protein